MSELTLKKANILALYLINFYSQFIIKNKKLKINAIKWTMIWFNTIIKNDNCAILSNLCGL
jgi:hypothetical protein